MARNDDLRKFRETSLVGYMKANGINFDSQIGKDEKVKLCSSDDFNNVLEEFEETYFDEKAPKIISHVGGFYVTASLAGLSQQICTTRPYVLFFDRKDANIQNAIFNTYLMQACDTKEEYICALLNLSDLDIIKALNPALYVSFIEEILSRKENFSGLNKNEKKKKLKALYEDDKDEIDEEIANNFVSKEKVNETLKVMFDFEKIVKYAKGIQYDNFTHFKRLIGDSVDKLHPRDYEVFSDLAFNLTDYLARGKNFEDFVGYLADDIRINHRNHILTRADIYNGYRALFSGRGSNVKFVSGIDISTKAGVDELESILKRDGFIGESLGDNKFAVDIAFIPHISRLKEAYPFLKANVQDYIMLHKNPNNKNVFVSSSTATLNERTLDSIGATFIREEREGRLPLKNLSELETRDGYPLLMFMAGSNFGNIYHSENDTENLIEMAIANKVDTVYVRGLIYGTYFTTQTSRRLLADPTYETLSSRLQAAKNVIKRLNDAGIRVVYQMGDEEYHLYEDLFKMYTKEQGVRGNNFLKREDLKSDFDWIRPIIIQELIPYLLRSGEDVINFYTDDPNKTIVSKVCRAIGRYKDGLPLGDLAKYINPEYLKDTDMFKIVNSYIDKFGDLSVEMMSNPNFSTITQYGKPNAGAIKNLRYHQFGDEGTPQLHVDSRQGFMSMAYFGDQAVMNVPQMINDDYYISHPELLSGIKEHVLEDPTHKRVTQLQTRPNYPGGWIVSGDLNERMTIVPYYKRVKEVMDYVQRTGNGLETKVIGNINDWQTGSPTERPEYDVKFIDYLFYECGVTGLIVDGDLQQGSNYGKYPNESRHLGAASMTQQMISNTKLLSPYLSEGMGVIRNRFEVETDKYKIDRNISMQIINHLTAIGLVEEALGKYGYVHRIKRGIDYRTVNLRLPNELKMYERHIRSVLSKIINLDFIDMLEGNHERNSDWNYKGFNEIELLRMALEEEKAATHSDIDLTLTEFLVNNRGDFVNAPYSFRTINGYNGIAGHYFKPGGKGGGQSPTIGISKWLEQMADNLPRIDKVNSAHYHIFESSVIDNTLITITGGGAGQSGYEQELGYSSRPVYVIEKYLPDGRICMEVVGTRFLDQYQIQNPYVKEMGLDAFIQSCMTEQAPIFDRDEPRQIQTIYQRKLVPKKPNKVIGPRID